VQLRPPLAYFGQQCCPASGGAYIGGNAVRIEPTRAPRIYLSSKICGVTGSGYHGSPKTEQFFRSGGSYAFRSTRDERNLTREIPAATSSRMI
jgi:hypothetical protein